MSATFTAGAHRYATHILRNSSTRQVVLAGLVVAQVAVTALDQALEALEVVVVQGEVLGQRA